jgi:hypothetical protein
MPKSKKKVATTQRPMVVDTYTLLHDSVALGIVQGWNRAHKHTDTPDADTVQAAIETAVMDRITEYFSFPEVES